MSSIIHCQEELINSTLMKTWAIFYFAAEKSRISICCLVMCWFSPPGCWTDVHHICRYVKYLFALHLCFNRLRLNSGIPSDGNLKLNHLKEEKADECCCFPCIFLTWRSKFVRLIRVVDLKWIVFMMMIEFQTLPYKYNTAQWTIYIAVCFEPHYSTGQF